MASGARSDRSHRSFAKILAALGAPAIDAIRDEAWFKETYLPTVQQRGAAIIKARGLSSAASAANAVAELLIQTAPLPSFSVA